ILYWVGMFLSLTVFNVNILVALHAFSARCLELGREHFIQHFNHGRRGLMVRSWNPAGLRGFVGRELGKLVVAVHNLQSTLLRPALMATTCWIPCVPLDTTAGTLCPAV